MENIAKCPVCHVTVSPSYFYCYNCGTNLKPAPPKIDAMAQIILYTKSFLLPPFGIYWALKYLKQSDTKSKTIGYAAIIVTVISLILAIVVFNNLVSTVNKQVNDAMNNFYSF